MDAGSTQASRRMVGSESSTHFMSCRSSTTPKNSAIYAVIIDNSGFGIDPRTDAPTAPKSVWDAMIAAHPSAAQFRSKALPDCRGNLYWQDCNRRLHKVVGSGHANFTCSCRLQSGAGLCRRMAFRTEI